MTAGLLREAAALMRKRAEAAVNDDLAPISWDECHPLVGGEKLHYSSWHPAVALAVATWLDSHADIHTFRTCDERLTTPFCPALAVARAYLGRES